MSLITKKPSELKPVNDLDSIPDDLLGGPPSPADIVLAGKTLTTLASPPGPGETVILMIRLRVYDEGTAYGDNGLGEPAPYKKTKLVSCWIPGQKEPEPKKTKDELEAEEVAKAAENQPPLYETDEDGQPVEGEPDTDPEDDDEFRADPANYTPPSGLDEFDPAFSHNEGGGR